MLTNFFASCKVFFIKAQDNKFKHCKKESKTSPAFTESLCSLREGIESAFENGLGVLVPIRGITGFARYSDTVFTFCDACRAFQRYPLHIRCLSYPLHRTQFRVLEEVT